LAQAVWNENHVHKGIETQRKNNKEERKKKNLRHYSLGINYNSQENSREVKKIKKLTFFYRAPAG
jgi:hypothetical protein